MVTNFTELSGTNGNFSYYSFYNYKRGSGFRPNSKFVSDTWDVVKLIAGIGALEARLIRAPVFDRVAGPYPI